MNSRAERLDQILPITAARVPGRPAFRCRDRNLSYAELLASSCRLARLLRASGVEKGDRVGILSGKTIELPIAVYGILSAGAAYVPLDPAAPPARIQSLIADCGIDVVISEPNRTRLLRQLSGSLKVVIGIEDDAGIEAECIGWNVLDNFPDDPVESGLTAGDLAYVIYTSGSTGVPKGIMHSHASAMAYARAGAEAYSLDTSDRLSNFPPLHFDQSTFDFFSGPLAGSCTVLITEDVMRFPINLAAFIETEKLTVWYSVPMPLIQMLVNDALDQRDLSSVRWILYGGESFPPKYLRGLLRRFPAATISNVYGPAETNQCTYYHFSNAAEVPDEGVPIGPAWRWAKSRIVDPADPGGDTVCEGELMISSPTMMMGYWGGRYPEVFVDVDEPDGTRRYYRTGDFVREDQTGTLVFLGRRDRMVKSRGQRVELDEIESAINSLKTVTEAAVFAEPDADGSVNIVAALIPADAELAKSRLLSSLQPLLAPAAIPSRFEFVDKFPRTTSGKIDRVLLKSELAKD